MSNVRSLDIQFEKRMAVREGRKLRVESAELMTNLRFYDQKIVAMRFMRNQYHRHTSYYNHLNLELIKIKINYNLCSYQVIAAGKRLEENRNLLNELISKEIESLNLEKANNLLKLEEKPTNTLYKKNEFFLALEALAKKIVMLTNNFTQLGNDFKIMISNNSSIKKLQFLVVCYRKKLQEIEQVEEEMEGLRIKISSLKESTTEIDTPFSQKINAVTKKLSSLNISDSDSPATSQSSITNKVQIKTIKDLPRLSFFSQFPNDLVESDQSLQEAIEKKKRKSQ